MIAIFTGEFTILILIKYGFKVCVILFDLYSTHFKVYIHLPCINTRQRTTSPFDNTSVISFSDHQKTGLYQGEADRCDRDRNTNIICLLQKFQAIQYFNQSVLLIVPDLNIFVFGITIFYLISRSALIRFILLCTRYLYNSTGLGC